MKKSCLKRGFTLIELLVVVLIIGVLAAIALPQYQKAVLRARAQEGLLYAREVVREIRLYYLEHGQWLSSAERDQLPFSPKLPKDWGIFEWLPGGRLTMIYTGKGPLQYNLFIYYFYSLNTQRIECKAYKASPSAVAACAALSNGNEGQAETTRRVFKIP